MINAADRSLTRKINSSVILNIIAEKGPISRADIAKRTGLNPATVSGNVSLLLEDGIVSESGSGESSGGRKPILLSLNCGAYYCIGVDMGISKVECAVINLGGSIVFKTVLRYCAESGAEQILSCTEACIRKAIEGCGIDRKLFLGIGVGVHGLVDSAAGISIYAPAFNWRNLPLKDMIGKKFDLPVFIENDVRAMTLGENRFGAAAGVDDLVLINVGTGVGSGIMIDGELYRGATFGAGEIGHICIADNGPRCNCGNYGCLEAMASGPAIARRVVSQIKTGRSTILTSLIDDDLSNITGEAVYRAACSGDQLSISALEETGRYIGLAVSNIINILNPEMIVIAGGVASAGAYIMNPLIEVARKKSMREAGAKVRIVTSLLGEDCGVIGGGTLVLDGLFRGPSVRGAGDNR